MQPCAGSSSGGREAWDEQTDDGTAVRIGGGGAARALANEPNSQLTHTHSLAHAHARALDTQIRSHSHSLQPVSIRSPIGFQSRRLRLLCSAFPSAMSTVTWRTIPWLKVLRVLGCMCGMAIGATQRTHTQPHLRSWQRPTDGGGQHGVPTAMVHSLLVCRCCWLSWRMLRLAAASSSVRSPAARASVALGLYELIMDDPEIKPVIENIYRVIFGK